MNIHRQKNAEGQLDAGFSRTFVSEKVQPRHLQLLAMIYVRQSTPQQVVHHQESTRAQYDLQNRAIQLGWPRERVVVIDDDLGKSGSTAEGRAGFQKLVSEVSLGHVGIIIGIEMSRLARSCKDWHQLLEVCGLFGTLIGDFDGVYDPGQFNDRLLLGLKGTMSEAELHIIKQRMSQGKIHKARRGELAFPVPIGYFRRPSGDVILDPDRQAQDVVRLVFKKFEELGTLNSVLRYLVKNGLKFGVRIREGEFKNELEWRRPNRGTLQNMLRNAMYAGAYVYGRRKVDPRGKIPGKPATGRRMQDPSSWQVLIRDRFPAYISWDQYEQNVQRLKSNRTVADEVGAPRHGPSLLAGLLICGKCGCRMSVRYSGVESKHSYLCERNKIEYGGEICQSLAGEPLDQFVTELVLHALAPASLELSLEAAGNLERERGELEHIWQQRLERATYETNRARKQYGLVDPENRLVARQLESEWEEKLLRQKALEEEFHRFKAKRPRLLSSCEREQIKQLASNIPDLWFSTATSNSDKKEIVRQVFNKITINVKDESEIVEVTLDWTSGLQTQEKTVRPVARLEQLSYFPEMCNRIRELAGKGKTGAAIATCLNEEGFRPPKRSELFTRQGVCDLIQRLGIRPVKRAKRAEIRLKKDEWLLSDLAQKIGIPQITLYSWVRRGWVKSHFAGDMRKYLVVWADSDELKRIAEYRSKEPGHFTRQRWIGLRNSASDAEKERR